MIITRHERPPTMEAGYFSLLEFDAAQWGAVTRSLFHHDDFVESALSRWVAGAHPDYSVQRRFSASENGRLIGSAVLDLPQVDNTHWAQLSIVIDPAHRRRGVGTALLDASFAAAREAGRGTVHAWTWEELPPAGARTLRAAEGDGRVSAGSEFVTFMVRHGFNLAQVHTISGLTLAAEAELEAAADDARAATPSTYELVQWHGPTPAELIDDYAALRIAMSTDAPSGEADYQPEVFDAARIRADEQSQRMAGHEQLVTAVLHDGRMVAFTCMIHDPARPEVGDQWDTLVVREHRGHGLGMLMKTASHAALRRHWPATARVITGNASENQWMLAINRRLGFRPIAASGLFQRVDGGR